MKASSIPVLRFSDKNGNTLLQCSLMSLPLLEDAVLRLSMEFFNDSEPCMIHRSAVMSRMYMELLEYFRGSEVEKSSFLIAEFPKRLSQFFDVQGCSYITVKKEGQT